MRNNTDHDLLVILRPNLHKFLKTLSKYYKICIYSHGMENYVEKILGIIDPKCKNIFEN